MIKLFFLITTIRKSFAYSEKREEMNLVVAKPANMLKNELTKAQGNVDGCLMNRMGIYFL